MTDQPETAALIAELQELLSDWPTMRALSALGAERATSNKIRAREIAARLAQIAA